MFATDPLESALEAGLRYVQTSGPSIRRLRCGKGFRYLGADGRQLKDARHLERIRKLVIPPAWTNVWICPSPNGHLQAVGWDAKGRKQYRYHALYRAVRDQVKFSRMIAFGAALAPIRLRVQQDLALPGIPRNKVLATVVRLLETSFIRVGNDEYAKENDSFGLTTMRDKHVHLDGSRIIFEFRGKSGKQHRVEVNDRRLARIVKQCQDVPGYELFQYIDENGEHCPIDSADVNGYIREIAGDDFTAKDFRTWAGTTLAALELHSAGGCTGAGMAKRTIVAAIKHVAERLGNRPATCRKYYIHPAVIDAWPDGSLFGAMEQGQEQQSAYNGRGLRPEEYAVLVVIADYQRRLAKAA